MPDMPHSAVRANIRIEYIFVDMPLVHESQRIVQSLELLFRYHLTVFPSPMEMKRVGFTDSVGLLHTG